MSETANPSPAPSAPSAPHAPVALVAAAHSAPARQIECLPEEGWTRDRQALFLRELGATHNVSHAARMVGMSRQSAYQLRARLRHGPFDRAWEAAYRTVRRSLYYAAMERALNGVEVPHYHAGELVGTSRRFDERLTVALLALPQPGPPPRLAGCEPGSAYEHDEFDALVERVAAGPDEWEADETRFEMVEESGEFDADEEEAAGDEGWGEEDADEEGWDEEDGDEADR